MSISATPIRIFTDDGRPSGRYTGDITIGGSMRLISAECCPPGADPMWPNSAAVLVSLKTAKDLVVKLCDAISVIEGASRHV